MSEENKPKRLPVKILESDFTILEKYHKKWEKSHGLEFNDVVDHFMRTATVRISALEKYAEKHKKEKAPRAKKEKPVKEPKLNKDGTPRKKRTVKKKEAPAAPAAEAAPASS